jgi:hypothetical protein
MRVCGASSATAICVASRRASAGEEPVGVHGKQRLGSRVRLGPLGQPEKAIGHESQIELWFGKFDHCSALLVSELTGFVAKKR